VDDGAAAKRLDLAAEVGGAPEARVRLIDGIREDGLYLFSCRHELA
jgi:hypothetical protein